MLKRAISSGGTAHTLSCTVTGMAVALGLSSAALSSGILLRLIPSWLPYERVPFVCLGVYFGLFQLTAAIGRLATTTFIGSFDNKQPRAMRTRVLAGSDQLRGWSFTARMYSAHANTAEGLPIFLAGIYAAREMGMKPERQATLSLLVIVCRLLYVPLYAGDMDLLRSVVWSTSFCASMLAVTLPLLPDVVSDYMGTDGWLVLVVGDTCE